MESQLGRGCGTRQSSDHQQPRSHRQPQQFHRTCRGSCPDCIRWFGGPHANAKTLLYVSHHVFWFTGKTHGTRHTAASATSVFDQHKPSTDIVKLSCTCNEEHLFLEDTTNKIVNNTYTTHLKCSPSSYFIM